MTFHSLAGILVVMLGGAANGSFPAPSKGIRGWKWEHVWMIYSLCAFGVLPIGLGAACGSKILFPLLTANPLVTLKVAMYGGLWGLGSVLFGISLVRLGMGITNALISGIVVFFGSLGPLILGTVHMTRAQLLWLTAGLSILVLSLALCAAASIARDRVGEQEPTKSHTGGTASSVVGVLFAIASGLLSSMLNFGFVSGAGLAEKAVAQGFPPALASVVIWVPGLFGGLLFNVAYPAYLLSSNHSWNVFFHPPGRPIYWFRAAAMGVLWFGAIQLYGLGASIMGREGAVYGWALLTAISILTSNIWGALTGEWRGSGAKPKVLMVVAMALLMCSFVLLVVQQMRG